MKSILAFTVLLGASTFSSSPSVDVQFLQSETKPIGVILRGNNIREFTDQNGQKAYWVTGKAIEEINMQIKNYKAPVHE